MGAVAEVATVRRRLELLLDSIRERRLVCVVGEAASGKTTLVRRWTGVQPDPVAWVVPVRGRDQPRPLLQAFVRATETLCPGLAETLSPELDADAAGAQADDPVELAAVLAGELAAAWGERATGPFTVVLDDFHDVLDPAGVAFVADLIRLYPRIVRMLVLSRTAPPFALHRLDAAGEYGEIGPRALRFEVEETAALFADAGVHLDAAQARAITDACGGWAGGLRLALESAVSHGVGDLVERLATTSAPDHLAAVALAPLGPAARQTVRTLSVLGRVERQMVADRPDSTARLDGLAESGLLVTGDPRGWTLTALARYAVDRVGAPDDADTRAALADGVDLAVTSGFAEAAVRWAVQHGDPALVRATLTRTGYELHDSGDDVLGQAATCLPVPVGDLAVDGLLASHFAMRGDLARAVRHLGSTGEGVPLPARVAWRVANALWMHGDAVGSGQVLDRSMSGQEAGPVDLAQLASARATLAWGRGDGALARTLADEALQLARESGDEGALGVAWVIQALVAALEGDLHRNQRCYSTALLHAEAARDVLTQLRVRCNLGSHLTETGRYRDAVAVLQEALRLGEATGQRTRVALARLNTGQAELGLGRVEQALLDIDAALGIWTEIESPMAAFAHQMRGETLARRGDRARAMSALRTAVAAAESQHDAQTLAPAYAWLARCVAGDDIEEAVRLADRALAEPVALGSVVAMLARGWVALLAGDHGQAASFARSARDEAARREDPGSLAQSLLLAVLSAPSGAEQDPRLAEARALGEEIGDEITLAEIDVVTASLRGDRFGEQRGRARLRALGVRDSASLVAGPLAALQERHRSTVTIRTLGTFSVELGDTAVPASAWQSRKARDLVKILVARRGRSITREALAELLWPDHRGDAAGNRLSVALSTARAVFDPAKSMPADGVLSANRDAVRLNVEAVSVDLEEYLALVDAALAAADAGGLDAVGLLEQAAAAYAGDFCEEDPYETWAEQTREELRGRHQQVLRRLADLLVADARPEAAVPWLLALVGQDPYDESAHLHLIGTLSRTGRHGEARRSYRTYVERMAEIDVEAAAFPQRARRRA